MPSLTCPASNIVSVEVGGFVLGAINVFSVEGGYNSN